MTTEGKIDVLGDMPHTITIAKRVARIDGEWYNNWHWFIDVKTEGCPFGGFEKIKDCIDNFVETLIKSDLMITNRIDVPEVPFKEWWQNLTEF